MVTVALQERARGKYCLIIFDDDYLVDPNYLQLAVDVILAEKYFGLIFSRCYVNVETYWILEAIGEKYRTGLLKQKTQLLMFTSSAGLIAS